MEIVIGEIQQISSPGQVKKPTTRTCEAKVLNTRSSRKRLCKLPYGERNRRKTNSPDPSNGRVVTLMVTNGNSVPPDIDSGKYRAVVKFVPENRNENYTEKTTEAAQVTYPRIKTDIIV